jgi:hypothetical protein
MISEYIRMWNGDRYGSLEVTARYSHRQTEENNENVSAKISSNPVEIWSLEGYLCTNQLDSVFKFLLRRLWFREHVDMLDRGEEVQISIMA